MNAFAAGLIPRNFTNRYEFLPALMLIVGLFVIVFFVLVGAGMDLYLSVINPSDAPPRSALIVAGFLFIMVIFG